MSSSVKLSLYGSAPRQNFGWAKARVKKRLLPKKAIKAKIINMIWTKRCTNLAFTCMLECNNLLMRQTIFVSRDQLTTYAVVYSAPHA